ncbi:MAG: InlB B-repeat-containing protein [Clostridia bacterium]|nr:InlB B-repeat-containing protein [Clostridia bacterium]
MKMSKKVLSVLLAVLLLAMTAAVAAVPASAVGVGDIIMFGNYPQSQVSETTALKAAANRATWKSYDYYIGTGDYDGQMQSGDFMKYADFISGGIQYRAVTFTQYRPLNTSYRSYAGSSYQDDNGYYINMTYYFKYEPLEWRVLDPSAGLVLCAAIIDSQAYQNVVRKSAADYYYIGSTSTFANNYAKSTIRTWLNNDFYNTAFNSAQKAKIKSTTINNDAFSSESAQYSSPSTTDKIFLLSYSEAKNSSYGLSSASARKAKGTDYAKCQGIFVESDGSSSWRLRSAGSYSYTACGVRKDGDLSSNSGLNYASNGIRPACKLSNLTSDISQLETYTLTLDVTSAPTSINGKGGTVTGAGTYTEGSQVTITAIPDEGYEFVGWYSVHPVDGLGKKPVYKNATQTITMNTSLQYAAVFKKTADNPGDPGDPGTTPTQPESVCPWCGGQHVGFFQGIIGFFHGIFAKLFGARY